MTQKEIIEFEETNSGVIRLYLEGSFYKAYERSAFAFCKRLRDDALTCFDDASTFAVTYGKGRIKHYSVYRGGL